MAVGVDNPYVGPLPFTEAERDDFFGREQEAEDLTALVAANRITLFYAPSGAGKSSLIQARIIPLLRNDEHFIILPVARVGVGVGGRVLAPDANIFVLNLISWLSTPYPADPTASRPAASHLPDAYANLSAYLGHRLASIMPQAAHYATAPILIIDQFEEILTAYPARWQDREAFFQQLAQAMLTHESLWLLLSLREEYVGALERYAWLLPGKLRTRFYMRRLTHLAALEAIAQPAANHQRPFAEDVAERLVQDLAQIRIEGGRGATAAGEFVEPIQLQVVCERLWENLQPRPLGPITAEDLAVLGDVNEALGQFYDAAVASVVADPVLNLAEFQVRNWFSNELITSAGTRGTVFQGENKTGGLDNRAVARFEELHLIRGEPRAGGKWYELVHDRFIEPILRANRQRQTQLAQDAASWVEAGKAPQRLYAGRLLAEAAARIEANSGQFPEIEVEFVETAIEQSLADYYDGVVAALVAKPSSDVTDYGLRDWFSSHLITPARTRRFVTLEEAQKAGIPAKVVQQLVDQAILQAQTGADGVRYGLTRESYTVPILLANNPRLTQLAQDAERWRAADKAPVQLYKGQQLADTLAQFARDPTRYAKLEHEFITAAQKAEQQRQQWRQRLLIAGLLGGGLTLLFLAVALDRRAALQRTADAQAMAEASGFAAATAQAQAAAERATAEAAQASSLAADARSERLGLLMQASNLTARANAVLADAPPLALLLAVEANRLEERVGAQRVDGEQTLRDLLGVIGGTPLTGHADRVLEVAFSPDGRWLASAGADARVLLWPRQSITVSPILLTEQVTEVNAIAFSPDGQLLAGAAGDGAVHLWRLPNGEDTDIQTSTLTSASTQPLYAVAIDAQSRLLAAGGGDGVIYLWDFEQNQWLPSLDGNFAAISSLAFSPDGRWLASAWSGFAPGDEGEESIATGEILVWDRQDWQAPPRAFTGHTDQILVVTFTPDSSRLASTSNDGTVRVWASASGQEELRFDVGGSVRALDISRDGNWLASGGTDGEVRLWRNFTDPASTPLVLYGHEGPINAVAFAGGLGSAGEFLASASEDTTIRLWQAGSPVADPRWLAHHQGPANQTVVSPRGSWLASAGGMGQEELPAELYLWATDQLLDAPRLLRSQEQAIWSISFSPDERYLASTEGNLIHLADLATGVALAPLVSGNGELFASAFSQDGRWLAAAGNETELWLWDRADLATAPQAFAVPDGTVWSLAFHPTSPLLATGSADGYIHLWDLTRPGASPQPLSKSTTTVWSVRFSPDGRWLAGADGNGEVNLWSVADVTAAPIHFRRHTETVWSVAFSPDTNWLASAGNDQVVYLWDVLQPGRDPVALRRFTSGVNTVSFAQDGATLVSGSADGAVQVWMLGRDALIHLACQTAGRNLTGEERTIYMGGGAYRPTCSQWP